MTTLLLNYIYYHPVGHAVEALQFAKGFHDADPESEWPCKWQPHITQNASEQH